MHRAQRNDGLRHNRVWIFFLRCFVFHERDLHAHVRQNFVVQLVKRNAHFHRGLLPVGAGNYGSYVRRVFVFFFRIRVQLRLHFLMFFHLRDVRLVDVHFNLVGLHVHDRRDACARKPAACGNRRHHFAHLRVFRNNPSRKRRTNRAVVHRLLRLCNARVGRRYLLLRQRDLCLQAIHRRARVVERLFRLHFRLDQSFDAPQLNFRQLQLHLQVSDGSFRGIPVRLGGVKRLLHVRIVQRCQKLAFLYVVSFVEENAGHAAGDFRGHRCPAPRRDVAAGVQRRYLV